MLVSNFLNAPTGRIQSLVAMFLTISMVLTVGIALGFEHWGGFMPCELCLKERMPYYFGIPLMILTLISLGLKWPVWLTRGLLLMGALFMVYGLGLAIFHAGVEWKFWAGPTECSVIATSITTDAKTLLNDINSIRPPSCSEAAGRFLGLSFAGWNVVMSFILALVGFYSAFSHA